MELHLTVFKVWKNLQISKYIFLSCESPLSSSVLNSDSSCSDSTAVIVSAVCSLTFLIAGVLLGVVTLYLILRARGKLSGHTSHSSAPLSQAVTYEEVGMSREVKNTHNIHLQSNEAYAPTHDDIHTSLNTAYGQVQLWKSSHSL